ncbi:MAG: 2-oxoglutarate dehydrogenase, E2 component, dihydrolipoamide succinyltransferase [Tetrasphaera jenkinsii]|jgi:pyruvate dehydrogenase E2 component (dihydrolipoamide acetyltransferase)|nr:2-oxoglutarate dehydrogenase, E2 component, dihydrolipoamide succinyltransferase [Tetrasphaera jenkinsii]
MSERVTMPALGESVTEGTVTRWLKNVGDQVAVDEPLLEVSTDKVDTEIPSPVAGTLSEILVQEDETVPVGADLCVIGDGTAEPAAAGDAPAAAAEAQAPAAEPSTEQAQPEPAQPEPATEAAAEPEAAPAGDAPAASGDSGGSAGGDSDGGDAGGGTPVPMPALGESVTEGTVTRWLKAEGDDVEVDEPLLEVSTDKVDTEIPSPAAGKLTKILVGEDETVAVGTELAIIGGSGGSAAPAAAPEPAPEPEAPAPAPAPAAPAPAPAAPAPAPAAAAPAAPAPAPAAPAPAPAAPAAPAPAPAPADAAAEGSSDGGGDASAYVTPLVRKLAADNGIDLGSIKGTGIGGRIRKQDVLDAAEAAKAPAPEPAAAPAPASAPAPAATAPAGDNKRGTTEKMSRLRKIIAQRMVESLQVSAQLTTVIEVDMTKVARVRDKAKRDFEQREGTKLSFLPFIALATVEALKAHPGVNASIDGDNIVYHGSENLSIAVDTPKGLIVPVVKNAGDLNIAGLARAIADVAARTRDNKITPDDLAGGTFTITNTGSRGALFDTPILNQPQVAMLGTGAIVRRPVVVEVDGSETIAIRSMMYLALSYDHRIVDGADAARFLTTVKQRLEDGNFEGFLGPSA